MPKRKTTKAAVGNVEIERRALEAIDRLGLTSQMRQAVLGLAFDHDYEEAARRAETTPEVVREWTQNPNFVMAVGWVVVGLADNRE